MKKLIFSAITMLAFAGSSMANTIELKEETIEKNLEIKICDNNIINIVTEEGEGEKTTKSDCVKIRNFTAMLLMNAGESDRDATYFANFVYDACMSVFVK